jgi:hypothetical protein
MPEPRLAIEQNVVGNDGQFTLTPGSAARKLVKGHARRPNASLATGIKPMEANHDHE